MMHWFGFIVYLLTGLLLFAIWCAGFWALGTLKQSDRKLFDGILGGFIVLVGGCLLLYWLAGFLLVAPFYIPFL